MMVTDPLTGVYSRATLQQRMREEIMRAERYHFSFSIILLDLDHYKSINDAFGHHRGDEVLAQFADRLRKVVRESDILYRYGGDEFLILLPNTNKEQAAELSERLLHGVRNSPFGTNPPITLSISLGVAAYPDDALSPEALFEKADQRHYLAKRRGRGRWVAEDASQPEALSFDSESRLIERDESTNALNVFLRSLEQAQQGVFIVTGPPGVGRTRFLSEAGKIARLQGYEVISLRGSPALVERIYGDLGEVIQSWDYLVHPSLGTELFAISLNRLVSEKGRSGLIFTVEDMPHVDWATKELLQDLLSHQYGFHLGLVYSAPVDTARQAFPAVTPLVELIELAPLSEIGVQIWLRTALQWEPPDEFTTWLYRETGGLPGYLQRALIDLVEQNILQKQADGWAFTADYTRTPMRERLNLQVSLPANNLPAATTPFIGRQGEIMEARKLLNANRLITITGPGGMGKTRLALQVARETTDRFREGVTWVSLASVSDGEFIVPVLAESLEFSFFGRQEPEEQVLNYLREKEKLLVLDNFEHLAANAGFVSRLLENVPGLKIIVTSRERLNLRGEAVLELHGMQFPLGITGMGFEGYAAVQLFLQSARRAQPNFTITTENRTAIAKICQLVEGLPLAIEIAAGWVRLLSCQEIAEEMERNLDFLTSNMRDMPERHRSLRAVFEHSWRLLLPEEQEILSRMSIFQGSFSRIAAKEVIGAEIDQISSLVDKSLITRRNNRHYTMHEVLRQYASEKLDQLPQAKNRTHQLHSAYYARFLAQLTPKLSGAEQKEGLHEIGLQFENLRTAWEWAAEHERFDLMNESLPGLFTFFEIRGRWAEGNRAFQKAQRSLQKKLREMPKINEENRQAWLLFVQILNRRGAFKHRLAQYDASLRLLEHAARLAAWLDDKPEQIFTALRLGMVHEELGEYEKAQTSVEKALKFAKIIGDKGSVGRSLNQLGAISYQIGEFQRAEIHLRDAMKIFREFNEPFSLASTLINLGNIESELGEMYRAKAYYLESLKICEEIGARRGMAASLNNIGDIAREEGNLSQAHEWLERSLHLSGEIGDRFGAAVSLSNLGDVALRQGEFDRARAYLNLSLEISEDTGNTLGVAYALASLGALNYAVGDYAVSRKQLCRALNLAIENQATPLILQVFVSVAALFQTHQEVEFALELLAFVEYHPAVLKYYRGQAEHQRQLIAATQPEDVIRTAEERGRLRPLDEFARLVLDRLSP